MEILNKKITVDKLQSIAEHGFGEMIKAVVDIEKKIIAIDAELHSDLEALLLENSSEQKNLWGINYYPEIEDEDFIEYASMINIRPSQKNHSRDVENEDIRRKIVQITDEWITRM